MLVDVYRNLHKDCYSIRDTVVLGGVTAQVGRKGRERVLREGRRTFMLSCGDTAHNVFVVGDMGPRAYLASAAFARLDRSVHVSGPPCHRAVIGAIRTEGRCF